MKPARQRSRVLQILVLLMVLLAVGFGVVRALLAPADEKVLQEHVGDLRSAVTEVQVLLHEDQTGHLSSPFRRTELHLLAEDMTKTGESLQKAKVKPELVSRFQDAAALAKAAASVVAPLSNGADTSRVFSSAMVAQGVLPGIRSRLVALESELQK